MIVKCRMYITDINWKYQGNGHHIVDYFNTFLFSTKLFK